MDRGPMRPGSNDFCVGHVLSGPDPQTPGDPKTHQYAVQAWSIAGTGRHIYEAAVVVARPEMEVDHFPLAPGDPVFVSIVGSVIRYSSPIGNAHWDDCP